MQTIKKISLLFFFLSLSFTTFAQTNLLQSGPMVSYTTMKEALLWVQTTQSAKVYFKYWDVKAPQTIYKTQIMTTKAENAFVAQLYADKLEPSNQYKYELYINNKKVNRPYELKFQSEPLWKWRGDAPDFSFATGSCAYVNETVYDRPGTPYGSHYEIFESISQSKSDFMLWLGDNLYLREADWDSRTGILQRYTHTRSLPQIQPMLGNMAHYSIWDDHDFGPDNSDRSFNMKKETDKVFKSFYPSSNYIFEDGTTSFFDYADCDFFLLDNRYWRSPDNRTDLENPTLLGNDQLQWLLDALSYSKASFKFVVMGGQFLNPLKSGESYENCAPKEKQTIIETIQKLKINGVIFITGDVHYSELSKYDLPGGYPLYDLTVSPLTSGLGGRQADKNTLNVEGTRLIEHNYAKMEVFGTLQDRTLRISILNSEGLLKWSKEIKAGELKF
jgi:alkaline phosphatase D